MRLEFSSPTKRDGLKRANGKCECARLKGIADFDGEGCGQPLGPANTFFEHIICDGLRKNNSLENMAVLTKTCWARKTKWDLTTVSTAKRKADRHSGIREHSWRPMDGSRNSRWKKKMDGSVERRNP